MSKAVEILTEALKRGEAILAETLRQAGVKRNIWSVPSFESLFLTEEGPVVMQGTPLVSGAVDVPSFDEDALVAAIRTDQAGESTFPEFLEATWRAGVVRYDIDFDTRKAIYEGCNGEKYLEIYPAVSLP